MNVDEDFETVLRREFHLQEPRVEPTSDLTRRIATEGRRQIAKLRTRYAVLVGVGAVALSAAVSVNVLWPSLPERY